MNKTEISAADIAEKLSRLAFTQTGGDEELAMRAFSMCVVAMAKQMARPIQYALNSVSAHNDMIGGDQPHTTTVH